jgi:hypothetical protein
MNTSRYFPSLIILAVGAVALSACDTHAIGASDLNEANPALQGASTVQEGTVYHADLSEVEGAQVSLLRRPTGLGLNIQTSGLPPGETMTIWWAVFNFPEHCEHPIPGVAQCGEPDLFNEDVAAAVLYATGHVIGGSGRGNFAASLNVGDLRGCQSPLQEFGLCKDGLTNPSGAEVHFVVRSHGPRIPGLVSEQIRTFAGGCTPETSFGAGTGPNECVDLQFGIIQAP